MGTFPLAAPVMSLPGPLELERRLPDGEGPFSLAEVYERFVSFVWRNVRRLGVPDAAVDDAVQDVFLVVHRRLAEFEGRSRLETWLYGILLRVVSDHRRAQRRRINRMDEARSIAAVAPESQGGHVIGPHDLYAQKEAVATLYEILDGLDEDRRAVLVAVDLEQMSVVEAASALDINLNTAYARLRSARLAFDDAVARRRARGEGES